jgi:hypothetical protein
MGSENPPEPPDGESLTGTVKERVSVNNKRRIHRGEPLEDPPNELSGIRVASQSGTYHDSLSSRSVLKYGRGIPLLIVRKLTGEQRMHALRRYLWA